MNIKHFIKEILSFLKSPKGYISIKKYISYMNQTAKSLGMTDSFFDSASGASYTSYSTVNDLFKLASAAFGVDLIRSFSASENYNANGHDISSDAHKRTSAALKCPVSVKTGTLLYTHKAICLKTDRALLCILADDPEIYDDIFSVAAQIINRTYTPGENIGYYGFVDGIEVSHNQNKRFCPGSTVKLLTALCAYYKCGFRGTVTVRKYDIEKGSGSNYRAGETFNTADAIKIMLMESSNTLARAVAHTYGLMNRG